MQSKCTISGQKVLEGVLKHIYLTVARILRITKSIAAKSNVSCLGINPIARNQSRWA